jgi:ketosteroid isomerase-like protein
VTLNARRLEIRDIFERLITALGNKDFDGVEALLTEDAVFDWPYLPLDTMAERMIGAKTFRDFCEQGMATCDPYRHKMTAFYDLLEPDALIAEYYSDTIFNPTGARYSNKYLAIARFRGDRVCYWKEYINPMIVKNVMGI